MYCTQEVERFVGISHLIFVDPCNVCTVITSQVEVLSNSEKISHKILKVQRKENPSPNRYGVNTYVYEPY